jgi:hypothetical protein
MTIHDVRHHLSWGLMAFAVALAAVLTFAMFASNSPSPRPVDDAAWNVPYPPSPYQGGTIQSRVDRFETPPDVNLGAQSELKQAGGCVGGNCSTVARPTYINGERVVHWGPSRVIKPAPQKPAVQPRPQIVPASKPSYPATIPATSATAATKPTKKSYQLSLFLDSSPQSQQIANWFNTDPQLLKLRGICEFQTYTPQNTLYQARLADVVPVDQFPVILFQDSTGGHIHAAGRTMIPGTAEELWDDILTGQRLWKQAKTGNIQSTGAIKGRGYQWDSNITPGMILTSEDCPDGYCPTPQPDTSWRPLDRIRPDRDGGGLFDGAPARNAFIWANSQEIITIALLILGAFLLFHILIRKGS